MVPAVLTDVTGDNVQDIIVASFNSTVYAFDGKSLSILWHHSFAASETVSAIVPGHFNNDNITDVMVKYNAGPGFPIYYYSQTAILSGVNGELLLDSMIKDSGGPYSLLGGVSISQSFGGDFFLHWQTHCKGQDDGTDAYQFIPGKREIRATQLLTQSSFADSDIIQQARADTCMLRYNTTTVLKLNAIARHIQPPGAVIFSTDDMMLQLRQSEMKTLESVSPIKHPKMLKKLLNKENVVAAAAAAVAAAPSVQPKVRATTVSPALLFANNEEMVDRRHGARRPVYGTEVVSKKASRRPATDYRRLSEAQLIENNRNRILYEMEDAVANNKGEGEKLFGGPIEPDDVPEDYEASFFNGLEQPVRKMIPMRSKYPSNRDVRSKMDAKEYEDLLSKELDLNNISSSALKVPESSEKPNVIERKFTKIMGNNRPETLWDLELEKEMADTEGLKSGSQL